MKPGSENIAYESSRGHQMQLSLYGAGLGPSTPCVVYLHGFKGFKDWGFVPYTAERFVGAGFRFLAVNFSHNGIGDDPLNFTELDKFRDNTFSLELEEAQEVIGEYANGLLCDESSDAKIGVLGHSRGGGIALLTAGASEYVSAVCTWAAVSTFKRYPEALIAEWKKQGFMEIKNSRTGQVMQLGYGLHRDLLEHLDGKLNIEGAVRGLDKPLCVIHGTADAAVSVNDAHAIYRWAESGELHVITDAGHTFGAKHPFDGTNPMLEEVVGHSIRFFELNLK